MNAIQIDHLSTSDSVSSQSVSVGLDFWTGIHSFHGASARKPEKMAPLSSGSLLVKEIHGAILKDIISFEESSNVLLLVIKVGFLSFMFPMKQKSMCTITLGKA